MNRGYHGNNDGPPVDSRPSHRYHHHHQQQKRHLLRDKSVLDLSHFLADPCPSSPDQPESAGNLRRHIVQSLMQHHRAIERGNHALQPVSPASYGSSMEMAPYNPAVTPTSSLDFKGRAGDSQYNLKTSTELLKVLNRIWSLEEQHMSNIQLIKALKTELDHARVKIKELIRGQQAGRHEIDDLMKQVTEEKLFRKSKEQDRIHSAIQSVREEVEDERKLRKRSESLHRKLARELSEVKSSLSNASKDLERERKSRNLLEDLCDEFAKGIKNYEQELHALKTKSDKDWSGTADQDRLILHISESWLDERIQNKLEEAEPGFLEKKSVVENLGFEIENYLQAKQRGILGTQDFTDYLLPRARRNSLESAPLNAVSAPRDVGDEDSDSGDSNCFELNKPSDGDVKPHEDEQVNTGQDETAKPDHANKKPPPREKKGRTLSNMQVKFEEQRTWATTSNGNKKSQMTETEQGVAGHGNLPELSISRRSEATEEGSQERKNGKPDGVNSNHLVDNIMRNHMMLSEGGIRNIHSENDYGEASRRNQVSPVRPWMSKTVSQDVDASESSTKPLPGLKETTLKAKLLEARSKGQRSRFKVSKGSS